MYSFLTTVEPHLAHTPEILTSTEMRTLSAVPKVFNVYKTTIEIRTPLYSGHLQPTSCPVRWCSHDCFSTWKCKGVSSIPVAPWQWPFSEVNGAPEQVGKGDHGVFWSWSWILEAPLSSSVPPPYGWSFALHPSWMKGLAGWVCTLCIVLVPACLRLSLAEQQPPCFGLVFPAPAEFLQWPRYEKEIDSQAGRQGKKDTSP